MCTLCQVMRTCTRCNGHGKCPSRSGPWEGQCLSCSGSGQVPATAEMLADELTAVMRRWFETESHYLQEIDQRNAAESDPNVDHAHDFCDYHMAIMEAMDNIGIDHPELPTEFQPALDALIHQAMRICHDRGFAPKGGN